MTSPAPEERAREEAKAMAKQFFHCFCEKPAPKGWGDACPLHNYEPDFVRLIATALARRERAVREECAQKLDAMAMVEGLESVGIWYARAAEAIRQGGSS